MLYTALEYFKNSLLADEKPCDARPHIVTTNVEHDAILLPLKHFEKQKLAGKTFLLKFTHNFKNNFHMLSF